MTRSPSLSIVLVAIILTCVGVELALLGADLGLWGSRFWRPLAYANGAFWRGLLANWQTNYSGQEWVMFVTYAFLHGGLLHLVVNMITLASLGMAVIGRVGVAGFALVYLVSMLTGAAVFTMISDAIRPMVGASGALFGLAGAWVVWDIVDTFRVEPRLYPRIAAVAWPLGLLLGINLLMAWLTDGQMAWETHLGGFLGGAALAPLWINRLKPVD